MENPRQPFAKVSRNIELSMRRFAAFMCSRRALVAVLFSIGMCSAAQTACWSQVSVWISPTAPLVCTNTSVTFTASATSYGCEGGSSLTYVWYVDGVAQAPQTPAYQFVYAFPYAGIQTVYCIATASGCGSGTSNTADVTTSVPGILFSEAASASPASTGTTCTTIYFDATTYENCGSGTIGYTWHFGDGSTSTSQYASHTYSAAGTYNAYVVATDGTNTSTSDVTVTVNASVSPTITGLTASPNPSGPIYLLWNSSPYATDYTIYRSTSSGGTYSAIGTETYNQYYDYSVSSGTTYYYKVTGTNSCGTEGSPDGPVSATAYGTDPSVPAVITATPSSGQVLVQWSTVSGATSYTLFRDTTGGTFTAYQTGLTSATYTDTGLTNGVVYGYYVCAVDSAGTGSASTTVYATPGSTTPTPDPLAAGPVTTYYGTNGIQLFWTGISTATSYNIYRGTTSGGEGSLPLLININTGSDSGEPNQTYVDLSGTSGTAYYYEVTAVSNNGESGRSNEASAVVAGTPLAAPSSVTAQASSTQDVVRWSTVSGASTYNIYRQIGNYGVSVLYQIGVTGASYTDTSVTEGITYGYAVAAVDSAGQGAISSYVYATPGDIAPAAPTGLAASPFTTYYGSSEIALSWNQVPGVSSYNVYRGTTSGGEGSVPYLTGITGGSGTQVTCGDSGVTSGTTYYYEVSAVTNSGEGGVSNQASATAGGTAPAAPAGISAIASSGQIALHWSSVSGATSYNLYRNIANVGVVLYQLGLTSTSYTDTGLTNGLVYGYYVAAVDTAGQGVNSDTAYATPGATPPADPIGLHASPYSGEVGLTWNSVAGATAYNIYRSTTSGGEGSAPVVMDVSGSGATISYTDTAVSSGVTYYYEVTALVYSSYYGYSTDADESGKSNEASATVGGTTLSAPAVITAAPSSGQIALQWSSVSGATSYNLYRDVSGGSFIAYQVATTSTSYTDTGLTNGLEYGYYVAAVNTTGQGSFSSTIYATPGSTTPPAPTGLAATPDGSTETYLTWNPVSTASSYNVYRGTTSGGEASLPIATNVYQSYGYTSATFTDTGLTSGTTYYYKVTSVNTSGESGKSGEASATPGGTTLSGPASIAAVASSAQVALNWSSVSGATSYNLYRSVASGAYSLYQTGITSASYTDTGLTNGLVYGYYVEAVNSAGQGGSSSTVYGTPGATSPAAPTGLTATPSSGSVALSWNTVSGSDQYNVYRSTTSGGEGGVPLVIDVYGSGATATYTDSSVSSSTTYYYKVTAYTNVGEGAKSNEAAATTGATVLSAPSSISATASSGQVAVSWSTVTGASTYDLFRNVSGGSFTLYQTGLTSASYTDTGLTNGIAYGYKAAAVSTAGLGTSSSAAYGTPGGSSAPAAPNGLSAAPYGSTEANLAWNPVVGASSYDVYRGTSSASESGTPVATGITLGYGQTMVSYTDSSLTSGTTYYYEVSAVNGTGAGSKSNEASATPGGSTLSGPSIITAQASSGQVVIQWSPVSGATSYNLYRAVYGSGYLQYQTGLTSTSFTDTSVTNGLTYSYYVASVDSAGQGGSSATVSATPGSVSPAAPTGLAAAPDGSTETYLTWTPVAAANYYNVYRGTSSGGEGGIPVATNVYLSYGASVVTYTDAGLTSGTRYYYEVTAVGSSSGESAKSGEASATPGGTALSAPAIITAQASSGSVLVQWSTVSGASGYNLYRNVSSGATTLYQAGLTSATYTDSGVTNGLVYGYYVAAVNSVGQGAQSSWVYAIPGGTPPPAPAGLTAVADGSTETYLSFYQVVGASYYNVYRGTSSGGEGSAPVATNVYPSYGSLVTYTDSSLTSGTAYYYKVTAVNTVGEGAKSNEAEATPGGTVLPAPAGITATASSGSVAVRWSSVSGATSYNLYRNVSDGAFLPLQFGVSSASYTDTSVTNGLIYGYYVAAVNSVGQGPASYDAYATPGGPAPAAPTGLTASSDGSTETILTWNPVLGASTYNLYRSTTSGGEGNVPVVINIYASGSSLPNYTDSGLTSGTAYYYKVTAVTYNGEGPQSNEAEATPGGTVLSAPSSVKATSSSGQAVVVWSAVTGATTYNLYRNISGGAFALYQLGLTTTTYTDTGLTNGLTYGYYVTAANSVGTSSNSQTVYATPGDAVLPGPTGLTGSWSGYYDDIALTWIAPVGLTSYGTTYNVYRGTYAGGEGTVPIATNVWGTDYTDSSTLASNTEYFYYVTSVDNVGEGGKSNEIAVLTGGTVTTGFVLIPTPPCLTLAPGTKAVIAVQVKGASSFSGPVNLTYTGVPTGVAAWCYAPSVTVNSFENYGEGANFWVVVSPTAAPGNYEINLTGTAGTGASYAFTQTVVITLTVT